MSRASRSIAAIPALVLTATLLPTWAQSTAQAESPHKVPRSIPRAESAIQVDGVLDEPAWSKALALGIPYEVWPGENRDAPVKTEALLLYDDKKVYVGFRAFDPEPEKIRARLSDRDRAFQDDFVGIVFDTFNDERRAFEFFVNALGVQMDLVQDDVNGNEDSSWDAIWDSGGHINEAGYEVELAIPYTSLRFQRGQGNQIWGLDLVRIYPRDQRYTLAMNRRDREVSCYLCQLAKVSGFEGAAPGRNLEIVPTFVAGRTESRDATSDSFDREEDYEPGLTARWGITPNLTLSGTVNPDFSQVEADVARLDINQQFALFFPESRPFFLEGADFFDTPINAVHTRTVADPAVGAKLTGKEGKHALGVFMARDEAEVAQLLIPGSQGSSFTSLPDDALDVGVVRYRRDVGKNSAVGALVTAREGDDYHNHVLGIDTLLRPTDKDTVRFQLLGSRTQYPDELFGPLGELEDTAMSFRYRHDERNWEARASYLDFGADFRSDVGFVPRVDYRTAIVGGEYTWWKEPEDWFSWLELGGDWDQTEDQSGRLLEREVEMYFLGSGPKQFFFFISPGHRTTVFQDVEFSQDFLNGFVEVQPTGDLHLGMSFGLSDREDFAFVPASPGEPAARQGEEFRLSPSMRYNLGRHVQANLFHNHRRLEIDEGRLFTADLTELRLVYQFNVRSFVRAIVQYLDVEYDTSLYPICAVDPNAFPCSTPVEENLFGQFLFSYKLNPQTALFVGYTDNQVADQASSLASNQRTLFLKLGYAWVP